MEPRSFKRGNQKFSQHRALIAIRLQWSHVHSNVETFCSLVNACANCTASMEPRSFKRGNQSKGKKNNVTYTRFNGATFIQTWKLALPSLLSPCTCASMEPRSFKRGNKFCRCCHYLRTSASMEPRSFKRGNVCH